MEYKRYEKYRDSGVKWIGEIPEHWRVIKLKWLLKSLESGKREIDENNDFNNEVLSIGGEHIGWQGELILNNCRYISFEFYSSLRQGKIKENDILLVKDGATIGKCAFTSNNIPYPAAVNEHVFILRTLQNINPKFVFYLIQSDVGQKQIMLQIRGAAQPGLSSDFKSNLILTLPPLNEQTAIANFLDQKTAEIDSLIADKEKMIQLLQEKRQAIISEAVTKGLNSNVRMKDSGVEWIGEIPEGWKITKIKYTTYVKGRIGWQGLRADEFIDEGPYLVTGTDFVNGEIFWENCYHISDDRYNEAPEIHLKEGDLLITKDGTIGKTAIVKNKPEKATLNSGIFVTRPLNQIYITKYMYWLLNSSIFNRYIDYVKTGSTISHLYQETFENFIYPLPEYDEQKAIIDYLDHKTAEIDSLISDIQAQIAKLKEYRQSLIYEAVTGKIDVRDYNFSN